MGRDLLSDLDDVIVSAWRKQANRSAYVSIDTVAPGLAARGHNISREDLAENMKMLATLRGWDYTEAFGDTVEVLPN